MLQTTNQNPGKPSNTATSSTDQTTNFFNNFYTVTNTVSSNTDDAIVSFFETQTGNVQSAQLLAQAVINTALQQKENPMTVLDHFKKMQPGELNAYLSLYLNLSRVNTSLLGITNVPKSNKYVKRTIIL